jgi:CrcB protein
MIWYIAFGSALGGAVRYLLGGWIQSRAGADFPVGTLVINVTGSFLLGVLYRYASDSAAITPELRAMLTIGICGGYTTFSTFSYETVRLFEDGEFARAGTYVALSVVVSIAAAFFGIAAGRELVALRRG